MSEIWHARLFTFLVIERARKIGDEWGNYLSHPYCTRSNEVHFLRLIRSEQIKPRKKIEYQNIYVLIDRNLHNAHTHGN